MNRTSELKNSDETVPFYPDHVRTEFRVVVGILALVVIVGSLGLFLPVGLGNPADPMNTPEHVKPEWYFLALYQVLKFVPKTAGVVAPILAVVFLFLLPFIDRKPDKSPYNTRNRLIISVIIVLLLIALSIWGEVS